MEQLENQTTFDVEMVKRRGYFIFRKYSNYNFYFIDTDEGLKEIKMIHIYENGEKLLTMNKPWFKGVDKVFFKEKLRMKKNIDLESNKCFYTYCQNRKHIELYMPNDFVGFKKIATEELNGFYKKVEIYKTENHNLGFHKEEIFTYSERSILKKMKSGSSNNRKALSIK